MSTTANYKLNLQTNLDTIAQARQLWEEGTLRAANTELYAILERCFALYSELRDDTAKRRALNALLTDLAMKPKSNTSLGLKVIRYVFGKEGVRELAYSKVLSVVYDLKGADQSFTSYIEERGGIEEIRRESAIKTSTKMTSADYKQLAVEALQTAAVSVTSFKLPTYIQPNSEYDEDYVVGLIRCNSDGTGDLMFGNNDAKVIDTVLTASGKDLDAKAQDALKGMDEGDIARRRAADVKAFAPKLFAATANTAPLNGVAVPGE